MADSTSVVHIGENSPEHVAYRLFHEVMTSEKMSVTGSGADYKRADRKYLLDTFAECLKAAKGHRAV